MIACPVNAYEKDPITGIVKHLDDQCFGCQYCTLACPYEVPKYHAGKGIVRKCDMCSSRLEVGEAPACGACHTLADAGTTATTGPNLTTVIKGWTPAQITEAIAKPNAEVAKGYPADLMPQNHAQSLTKPELAALVAYLEKTAAK